MAMSEEPQAQQEEGAPDGSYMLGRSESETNRLIRQSGFYGRFTWRLLRSAGIGPGMRVLDVGTGAGDVALLAAELVGPEGEVLGLDQNPDVLKKAKDRARERGHENMVFLEGDLMSAGDGDRFDAVVGRFVLMYQPDPTEALRSLVQRVRAGGVVAFQEMNPLSDSLVSSGPTPLWDQARGWMHRVIEGAGVETEMGYRIHGAFSEVGLGRPSMESNAPMDGGPGMEAQSYFVETLRSLMPLAEKLGIVSAEEAGLDTLAERLLEEVVAAGAVLKMPDAVSAHAKKT